MAAHSAPLPGQRRERLGKNRGHEADSTLPGGHESEAGRHTAGASISQLRGLSISPSPAPREGSYDWGLFLPALPGSSFLLMFP